MSKKIFLLLIFWTVFQTLFLAQAQEEESKNKTITIINDIVPKADEKGNIVFTGEVKNNTKDLLHSVEIVFEILDAKGKILESITVSIMGKQEGILEGEEFGNFEVKTNVRISDVDSYKYYMNWKTFAKGE